MPLSPSPAQPGRRRAVPPSRSSRAGGGARPGRRPQTVRQSGVYRQRAEQRLRRFRGASVVAVGVTALLLMAGGDAVLGQETGDVVRGAAEATDPAAAVSEATRTIRDLLYSFYGVLPRVAVALVIVAVAWVLRQVLHAAAQRTLGTWPRRAAVSALTGLVVYAMAAVAAISVLAGDVRAMVGSIGLLGLAASWALQTPIESFTGWLLNAFRGYYQVGDRIAVGEVFGDVFRIDMLTTTVWEAGGPGKAVSAAQATGALITFPNWEVLRSNIVNYSRDFPFVWDELSFGVTNESDLPYAVRVIEETAHALIGEEMAEAVTRYDALLRAERLEFDVDPVPRVYLSMTDAWTNCTLRYLVPLRARRAWASRLIAHVSHELGRPEHRARIHSAYPRQEVRVRRTWDDDAS